MVTPERIRQLLLENNDDYLNADDVPNKFIAGLLLLQERSDVKHGSKYSAEHDIVYADSSDTLVDLAEDDVLRLNMLGWNFETNDRFSYYT